MKSFSCKETSINFIKYSDSELIKFFQKANKCAGDTNQMIKSNFTKNYIKVLFAKNFSKEKYDIFDVESYTFGLEFEHNMPFFNNAVSIALVPHYTMFNSDEEKTQINFSDLKNQFEIALLLRYYPFNAKNYKIFLGLYAFDWLMSNYITRTVYAGNPLKNEKTSQLLIFNNIELGLRYKDFEIFGLLNISPNYLQRNQASIGLKYNIPFIK